MNSSITKRFRVSLVVLLMAGMTVVSVNTRADSGSCNGVNITLPFTDVGGSAFFCQIANAYFAGITNGTSATAFSPGSVVTRDQMAAFTTRTLNQSLRRSSQRAALGQWWQPQVEPDLPSTPTGIKPNGLASDGVNVWVANFDGNSVTKIFGPTGGAISTWTGATDARNVLVARGRVFVLGQGGVLYQLDPTAAPGTVQTVASNLGTSCDQMAYDGSNIWGSCAGAGGNNNGNIFKVALDPVSVTLISGGDPGGILFDGTDLWITDRIADTLTRRTLAGATTNVDLPGATGPGHAAFDGVNLWVPDLNDRMFVVRIQDSIGNRLSTPILIATLTGNGLLFPFAAAFDGQRILVNSPTAAPNASLSLWRASDLAPLGFILTNGIPQFVCSDGLNFWISFNDDTVRRF